MLFSLGRQFYRFTLYIHFRTKTFGKIFANCPGDWGSILGQVIPKIKKIALGAALINTQHYKVCIKGKMEQSKEWSSTLLYTSV